MEQTLQGRVLPGSICTPLIDITSSAMCKRLPVCITDPGGHETQMAHVKRQQWLILESEIESMLSI